MRLNCPRGKGVIEITVSYGSFHRTGSQDMAEILTKILFKGRALRVPPNTAVLRAGEKPVVFRNGGIGRG